MKLNIIKFAPIIEKAKTSFWFIPSLMIFGAIFLAVFTVYIDAIYMPRNKISLPLIYGTDVNAIRSLLSTIAGSMITVTSIAFSITIVALTLASSQFGPRLLRNFMMDRGTQVVLGSFVSNFLFCILVFCAISFEKPYDFNPGLSVATAILMTFACVGILIYFIHHVAKSIQADVVIDDVYRELESNIQSLFPSNEEHDSLEELAVTELDKNTKNNQLEILSDSCGYLQTIDNKELFCLAEKYDLVIVCHYSPGNFVEKGATLAHAYSDNSIDSKIHKAVIRQIKLGAYRTPVQDPEFAVHQLVEIALRALSPGINDPFTAITCVDKLSAVLCGLTDKVFPQKSRFDDAGMLRLITKELSFTDIGRAAFDQIRQDASTNVAVTIRLIDSFQRLATFANNTQQKRFVLNQTEMIEQQQNTLFLAKQDMIEINSRVELVKSALDA